MVAKRFTVLFSAVCLLVFLTSDIAEKPSYAQAPDTHRFSLPHYSNTSWRRGRLRTGESLKREIARDEVQSVDTELTAGQYAEVVFEWQGINLGVALFDPAGAKLIPADVQVSSPGPVSVSILADKTGAYKLEVTAQVKQKISGKYEIKLGQPHLPSSADHKRLAAQTLIAQGQTASTNPTKLENYKQALTLLQEAEDVNGAGRVLMLLGDTYRAARDLPNANASYEQAVSLWNKSLYPRGEAYAKVSLAQFYRSLVSAKDSLVPYEQAELLFAQMGDARGQADALYGHAFALMLIGQTPQAIPNLEQLLKLRRAIGDRMGEASGLNMLADANRLLGDYDKCLDLYDQATRALAGLEHRSLEASIINGRALVYDDQGYWQQAKEEYARTIAAYESQLGQPLLSACGSSPSSQNASICRSAAVALFNLGEVYNSLGASETALLELNKSLVIQDVLGRPVDQGMARFHLGYTHFLLGNTAGALDFYEQALGLQQKGGDEKGEALTYTYMGMAYTARHEPKLALDFYQKALPMQRTSGDRRSLAITLDKLATGYSAVGNTTEASRYYTEALQLWRTIKDPDGEALTLYNLALSERNAGNLAAANQYAEATTRLVESLRSRLSSERLRASYLANKTNYYELDIDLKMQLAKSEKNDDYLATAIESNEKAKARVLLDALGEAGVGRSEFNQSSDPRLSTLIQRRPLLLAKLAAKAIARTKLLSDHYNAQQIAAIDKDLDDITGQYDELEAQLRTESPRFAALTKPQPAKLPEIQQQLDDDTLLLEFALGEKRSYAWVVSRDSLNGAELVARDKIELVARRVIEALTARNHEEKNENWPQRLLRFDKAEKDYVEASAALSKLVLEPVASSLGHQKRLVIVADGALQLVPFAALPVPASSGLTPNSIPQARQLGKPATGVLASGPMRLVSQYEIVSLPSMSVLALQRRELANRKPAPYAVAVIADPVFDSEDERVVAAIRNANHNRRIAAKSGRAAPATPNAESAAVIAAPANRLSPLASALRDVGIDPSGKIPRLGLSRREAMAITHAAPANESLSALNFKASRETVTSKELSQYRILHFATHGVLDLEHPELSGMLLSMVDEKGQPQDGYLRLHEIYNLNLPAELVVLSACQTGIGKQIKGEGLIALTRGFMYAGAKGVVASLWKVDDSATAALMAEFYKQMLTNKLKPAAALRAAQLKISQQKSWQSPYYWAGFFLQGEWNY